MTRRWKRRDFVIQSVFIVTRSVPVVTQSVPIVTQSVPVVTQSEAKSLPRGSTEC